ncbi:01P13-1 [Rhynchospora pubera]|uniref:01P13-1 n=1 Tax=Rhynchospora pubera TaxID=906938 RepID=A0AAV8CEA2_9POAL|nr:01P13-1 [Rhynchospora pubera]
MAQNQDKLTTELLNERNYPTWARAVSFALSGRGKIGHITGTKKKPVAAKPAVPTDEETKAIEDWQMSDHQVMTCIFNSVESRLSKLFLYTNSARELWKKIETMYGSQNNHAHIYQLKQEIYRAKKGSNSNTEYLIELQAKFDELDEYLPPTDDPIEIQKRQSYDRIYIYLGGLDDSYDALRSQILASDPLPSFAEVVAKIHNEDSRRVAMHYPHVPSHDNHAMAAKVGHRNPHPSSGTEKKGAPSHCTHCNKDNHKRDQCWFLYLHLRPSKKRGGDGGDRYKKWNGGERKGYGAAIEPSRENKREGSGFGSEAGPVGRSDSGPVGSLDSTQSLSTNSGATDHMTGNKALTKQLGVKAA